MCKILFVFLKKGQKSKIYSEDLAVCSRMRVWKTGQHDRRVKFLASHVAILAGNCPLTDRYLEHCIQFHGCSCYLWNQTSQSEAWHTRDTEDGTKPLVSPYFLNFIHGWVQDHCTRQWAPCVHFVYNSWQGFGSSNCQHIKTK